MTSSSGDDEDDEDTMMSFLGKRNRNAHSRYVVERDPFECLNF